MVNGEEEVEGDDGGDDDDNDDGYDDGGYDPGQPYLPDGYDPSYTGLDYNNPDHQERPEYDEPVGDGYAANAGAYDDPRDAELEEVIDELEAEELEAVDHFETEFI